MPLIYPFRLASQRGPGKNRTAEEGKEMSHEESRPFAVVTEMLDTPVGQEDKDDPAEVARQGFEALMAGREKIVGGSFKNKAQTVAGRFVPDSVKAEMHRKMAQPLTAAERSDER
jgi:hypothetical protein